MKRKSMKIFRLILLGLFAAGAAGAVIDGFGADMPVGALICGLIQLAAALVLVLFLRGRAGKSYAAADAFHLFLFLSAVTAFAFSNAFMGSILALCALGELLLILPCMLLFTLDGEGVLTALWKRPTALSLTAFLLMMVIVLLCNGIVGILDGLSPALGGLAAALAALVLSALMISLLRKGCSVRIALDWDSRRFGKSLAIGWPVIVYSGFFIFYIMVILLNGNWVFDAQALAGAFFGGVRPGVTEEAAFRAIILIGLVCAFRKRKSGYTIAALLSGLFFALCHLMNILDGGTVYSTLFQLCCTFGLGVFLSAVYLRAGDFWAIALLHGHIDSIGMMAVALLPEGTAEGSGFSPLDLYYVFIGIVLTAVGLAYLKEKHHASIEECWKFNSAAEPPAAPEGELSSAMEE